MLTRSDILDKLKDILIAMDSKNASKVMSVTEQTKLVTDLGLASVSMLYMVIAIEETFGIVFDNESPFVTVGEVVDFIEEKLK